MKMRLFVLGALLLAACGSGSGSSACALSAQVSGAFEWQSQGEPACGTSFTGSTGSVMGFIPIESEVLAFTAVVQNVMGGQTGSFPAKVSFELDDRRKWATTATGCTVTYEENTFVANEQIGKAYQTAGRGECTVAAMAIAGGATGTLQIAPFTFRFQAYFF